MRRVMASMTAVLAAFGGVAAGATAAEAKAAQKTRLVLTVAKGETPRPAAGRATLTCGPVGGSHQRAAAACGQLKRVKGDFAALRVTDAMCTMQYEPVTVTAKGDWKGKKVAFQRTYGNGCVLSTETGSVFGF